MNGNKDPKFGAALSAGILLIFFGLVFLLDRLGMLHAGTVWGHWPAIVFAMGLLRLWRTTWLDIGGHMMVAAGAVFELARLSGHPFRQLWPLLIVWLGVVFVFRALSARKAA